MLLNSCLIPSDNEEDRISQNGRPTKSEFKDEEEVVTPKSVQVQQTTENTPTTSSGTRKRGGMPSKTVDLGAAAHYTGDKSSPDADNTKVGYVQCHLKCLLTEQWLQNGICEMYVCYDSHYDRICHLFESLYSVCKL